mgnify:CR=1 FL=1
MFYKIIAFILFPCLVVALVLSFVGVDQIVLDNSYMTFLKGVSHNLESWSLEIPKIPSIPKMADVDGGLLEVVDILISFFNGVINVLNILITIINVVISLLQFLFTIIYSVITFRDTMSIGAVRVLSSVIV